MSKLISVTRSRAVDAATKESCSHWDVWDSSTHPQTPKGSGKFHFDYADNHEERVLIISGKAKLTPDHDGNVM